METEDLDEFLLGLPKLPRQPDEPGDFAADLEIEIEIEVEPVIVTATETPAVSRAPTAPIGKNASAVRELQLAAERRTSEVDGRVPLSERQPGQGSARKFT